MRYIVFILSLISIHSFVFPQCQINVNGGFEGGQIGFSCPGHNNVNNPCLIDGEYIITNSVAGCYAGTWWLDNDHTTGSGNFLAVNIDDNVAANPNPLIYCTTVNTQANQVYDICFWAYNISGTIGNEPQPQLEIDGVLNGNSQVIPVDSSWHLVSSSFTATNPVTNVCIRNMVLHNGGPGFDIALDDIFIGKSIDSISTQNIGNSLCQGDPALIEIDIYGCSDSAQLSIVSLSMDTTIWASVQDTIEIYPSQNEWYYFKTLDCNPKMDSVFISVSQPLDATILLEDFCQNTINSIQILGDTGGVFQFLNPPNYNESIDPASGNISNGVAGESYVIQYTVGNACPSSFTDTVRCLDLPTGQISGWDNLCDSINTNIVVDLTGVAPFIFSVTNGSDTIAYQNILQQQVNFEANSEGNWQLIYIQDSICPGLVSGQALAKSEISGTHQVFSYCDSSLIKFSHNNFSQNCNWIIDDSISINSCSAQITMFEEGLHTYQLNINDSSCNATFKKAFNLEFDAVLFDIIVPSERLTWSDDYFMVQLFDISKNATSYEWRIKDKVYSNDEVKIPIDFGDSTIKVCMTYNTLNCSDSICKMIRILPSQNIYAPNSFSPNQDGINDLFRFYATQAFTSTLQVFDRWGSLVFQSEKAEWNGEIEKRPAPIGTYSYVLDYQLENQNTTQRLIGPIFLVR
ncbi:MAG: gliding motility-associated C-terminal domain-containing protein [Flavobacteriales bacterium]|nr:gliding motility-associated C-terminal domain-containing protein [Flavobacteriales bacterium]